MSQIVNAVGEASQPIGQSVGQKHQVIVEQDPTVRRMPAGLLSNGHLLIEGAQGFAKTVAVSRLAREINTEPRRLQFTLDPVPADLVGTLIYRPTDGAFAVQRGSLSRTSSSRTRSTGLPRKHSPLCRRPCRRDG